jgi:hypothetical protein
MLTVAPREGFRASRPSHTDHRSCPEDKSGENQPSHSDSPLLVVRRRRRDLPDCRPAVDLRTHNDAGALLDSGPTIRLAQLSTVNPLVEVEVPARPTSLVAISLSSEGDLSSAKTKSERTDDFLAGGSPACGLPP